MMVMMMMMMMMMMKLMMLMMMMKMSMMILCIYMLGQCCSLGTERYVHFFCDLIDQTWSNAR